MLLTFYAKPRHSIRHKMFLTDLQTPFCIGESGACHDYVTILRIPLCSTQVIQPII
jgi:hypothetical protein